mmetsp:Transcript_64574/g.155777  ORF Transcript_64574/g.155777 Transcript_64574/m.155777 type:complete len:301 (-) Transcript_64574:188-1090(-)
MARLLVATMLLCLSTVDSFVARGHSAPLPARRDSAASSQPATPKTRHGDVQMFPGGGGSFLNLGTPEMIVIGACAWALLGPKELYRLSAEAGKFLGEWQQLGLQAKNTFTDALESEMREDEEVKRQEEEAAMPVSDFSEVPTMEELEQQRRLDDLRQQEMEDAPGLSGLADEFDFGAIGDELGPETPSKFASQMSGDTNAAIMEQFPAELGSGDVGYRGVDMEDDFEAEEISEEEDMLDTRIAEAENMLKMLATEQKVLELRREQQAANAARASDRRRAALADNIDERLPPQTPVEEMKE